MHCSRYRSTRRRLWCGSSLVWGTVTAALLSLRVAQCSASTARVSSGSDDVVFQTGQVPTDTAGQPVSAHEGWMLTTEDGYFWYGTSPKHNVSDGTHWDWLSDSILLYTSHDLAGWKLRATVFKATDVPSDVRQRLLGGSNLDGPIRLERPKVLYNAARRYYVLLLSLSSLDRRASEVAWAVSVSPWGPFKFDSARQPDGLASQDITVASQGDSDAWLARCVPGSGAIVISKLSADYLDSTGRCASIPPAAPSTTQLSTQQHQQSVSRLQLLWDAVSQVVQLTAGVTTAATGPQALTAAAQPGGSMKRGSEAAVRLMQRLVGGGRSGQESPDAAAAGAADVREAAKSKDMGAPCLFSFGGKWYMMAAQRPGWEPTKAVLYVNNGSSPCDEASWRQLPPPAAQGPGAAHTFDSTPAFVYAHNFVGSDQVLLIFFGDRWHPSDPDGPATATYVWLPLVPAAPESAQPPGSLQLVYKDSWRLGDFRQQQQQSQPPGVLVEDS